MPLSHLRGVPLNKTGFHVQSKILAAVFVLCRCHILRCSAGQSKIAVVKLLECM